MKSELTYLPQKDASHLENSGKYQLLLPELVLRITS